MLYALAFIYARLKVLYISIGTNAVLLFPFFQYFNREFADAKVCLKEAVAENCHFDKDAAEILQSAFDDYNPFCNVSSGEEGRRSVSAMKQKIEISKVHVTRPSETLIIYNKGHG